MRRVFLGWSRPAFDSVVDYLERRYGEGSVWDLSRVVLVLPGGRAGRRLVERLGGRAETRQRAYFPPQVSTVGQLPELLYRRRLPFASNLTQQLAWTTSLRHTSPELLRQFLRDVPPAADDPRWWELGSLLWRQHRELAADGLDFAQVALAGQKLDGFAEASRWEALACVQRDYLARLDALQLWDRQTARLYAIEHHECEVERDVLLVGTVDLNRSLRQMLDQVRQRVTSLVYADSESSDAFDDYGCLLPSHWHKREISLEDEQICLADRPTDQAAEVVRLLAETGGRYAAHEITVGVPDESLVPLVLRQLDQAGVPSRYGPGRGWQASRPARLVRAIVQYLAGATRASDLMDLVRHPDLVRWLLRHEPQAMRDIACLDAYCAERLVISTDHMLAGETPVSRATARLVGHVDRLLAPLEGPGRPPAEWVPPVMELLVEIYGSSVCSVDVAEERMIIGGCELLRDGLLELRKVPAELSGTVTATQAILMAMAAAAGGQIASPGAADAVEVLGWLELPLDDAPALIVTNVNEGTVPTSACADLFLPDRLRAHLGLDDNARRYARDAYALTVLARTREHLRLIVGRRDELGNPLLPSRLLFATDERRLGSRCRWFFSEGPELRGERDASRQDASKSTSPSRDDERPQRHGFFVHWPRLEQPVESLNVTDFREYLKCPYRFYLRRILKLESVARDWGEMDARAFGNLLHEVLGAFGTSAVRDATDPDAIERWLLETLDRVCVERFGATRLPAVQLQQEQMRWRLQGFAQLQARWRGMGWRIVKTEAELSTVETAWPVDGADIVLRGRVDRVDRHEDGTYAILDYKSSENGETPAATHLGGNSKRPKQPEDWLDLQLPIYRHFAGKLELSGKIELGYITLPRSRKNAGFQMADWNAAELETADEAARQIVRMVRAGTFWEPKHFETCFDEGLDRICQVGVFDRQLEPPRDQLPERADCQGVAP